MAIQPRRRRSLAGRLFFPVLFGFVVLVGVVGYTMVTGELRIPFLSGNPVFAFHNREGAASAPEGTVPILANPRPLPAYTRLTREHLFSDSTTIFTLPVSPATAEAKGLFMADSEGVSKLLGRVLARDKPKGFAFSDRDLLPKGTRGGLSAGIPPGKRGIWVDAEKVVGLADVQLGDRVDLIAAREISGTKQSPDLGMLDGAVGGAKLAMQMQKMQAQLADPGPRARSWVIAHDGVVVRPMRTRNVPLTSTSAFQGTRTQTRPVQEVFLALEPDEVAMLTQALATKATVMCAPRSGRPEGDGDSRMPDIEPPDPLQGLRELFEGLSGGGQGGGLSMVEVIRGESRDSVTVERSRGR